MNDACLYRYGALAWVWRAMGAGALLAAVACVGFVVRTGELWFLVLALPLVLPVVVLFPMVATRIELDSGTTPPSETGGPASQAGAHLSVATLAGFTRRIARSEVKGYRFRDTAASEAGDVHAPRAWVLVRGGWPIYVDLFADIPDKKAFGAALGLPMHIVRQGGRG
jgi:hypothetical protein